MEKEIEALPPNENEGKTQITEESPNHNLLEEKEAEIKDIEEKKAKVKKWLKNSNFFYIAGITAFAFIVRIYFLQIAKDQTHWWDSLAYGNIAKNIIFDRWTESVYLAGELVIRPPLFPYLWSILLRLNLPDVASIFILQVLPSVASVWLIFLIVSKMYGEKAGYLSAILFSVSWVHIFFTMRMLTDVPSLFFTLASIYFFISSYEKIDFRNFSLAIFFLALAVLTRYAYFVIAPVYLVFLLVHHKQKIFVNKRFYKAGIIGAIPLLIFFALNLFSSGSILPATSVYEAGAENQPFAYNTLNFIPYILRSVWLPFFLIGAVIALVTLILSYGHISKMKNSQMHLFNLLLLVTGLAFFIFFIRAAEDRYLFMIFLPLLSLTAIGITYVSDFVKKHSKLLGALVLVAVVLWGSYAQLNFAKQTISNGVQSFKPMKDAFLWVKENTPEDAVFLGMGAELYAIYYADRDVEAWPWDNLTEEEMERVVSRSDYLVINAFHPTSQDVISYIENNLQDRLQLVYGTFFDQTQTQPAVLIYKIDNSGFNEMKYTLVEEEELGLIRSYGEKVLKDLPEPEIVLLGGRILSVSGNINSQRYNNYEDLKKAYENSNGFLFCSKGDEVESAEEGINLANIVGKKAFCHFTKITINNEADIYKTRNELIDYLWPKGFPSRMPDSVQLGISDSFHDTTSFDNLERVDRITVESELGFNSIIYHFHPKESNGKLFLYHYGHQDDEEIKVDKVLEKLLDEGYSVVTFFMPLFGENNRPIVNNIQLDNHDQFTQLESEGFSPLKLFLEPIAVALNYLEKDYNYKSVSMVGISGGGWSTAMYSALDERVEKNYPIAGIMPIAIFDPGRDYEQRHVGILKIASSLDLFILGSYGEGRKQTQVFIMGDTCCFKGEWYIENQYGTAISKNLKELGRGEFEVAIDDSITEHYISENTLDYILRLEKEN